MASTNINRPAYYIHFMCNIYFPVFLEAILILFDRVYVKFVIKSDILNLPNVDC